MQADIRKNQPDASPPAVDGPASASTDARRRARRWLGVVLAVLTLAAVPTAGYLVVMARASGGGASLPLAPVTSVPGLTTGGSPAPQRPHWIAVRAQGRPLKVYSEASAKSKVLETLPPRSRYGVDTVMLVRGEPKTIDGATWYDVLLPSPPNHSNGWVPGSKVGMFIVYSVVKVDLGHRTLSVIQDSKTVATFSVAIGAQISPTPTGTYFITEKVRALDPNTVYGPLALGLSAFSRAQATASNPDGQVAIHGWTDPSVIGQAVSHGCIRMKIKDILALSEIVSVGSPVVIGPPFPSGL